MASSEEPIETFRRWTVPVLQNYLRCRNLKTSGKKEELVALVFSAHRMGIPIAITEKEELEIKSKQYSEKLNLSEGKFPDPLVDLQSGWVGEKQGTSLWPPTMYYDISKFLLAKTSQTTLNDRLMKDYKEGKAYSYFTSGWLKEVFYHEISKECNFCFLKADCTPSQRINDIKHTAWVLINKKTGNIESAYCTCFAGKKMKNHEDLQSTEIFASRLGETCNHVAAMLFKVDYAWQWGTNNKSCTSKPCVWNEPSAKKNGIRPLRLSQMKIMKPHYSKGGVKVPINPVKRQLFKPFQGEKPTLETLRDALMPACPDAAVFQYMPLYEQNYDPSADFNVSKTETVKTTDITFLPKSLPELAESCVDVPDFSDKLKLSKLQKDKITLETKGQSENPEWFKQRVGRITSSTMHSIHTKLITMSKKECQVDNLICQVLNYNKASNNIPSLKYGRVMEPVARKKYISILNSQHHQNLNIAETGLHIHVDHSFIAASPDGLVDCLCCGSGVLEIKCPISISHDTPTHENLGYLTLVNNETKLKTNHCYYTQIQGHMAVSNRQWCDFFVYTKSGYFLERILFDVNYWTTVSLHLIEFFNSYITPELLTKKLKSSVSNSAINSSVFQDFSGLNLGNSSNGKPKKRASRRKEPYPIYMCGFCHQRCLETEDLANNQNEDFSVGCDKCRKWFHWGCVGYTEIEKAEKWYCDTCQEHSK